MYLLSLVQLLLSHVKYFTEMCSFVQPRTRISMITIISTSSEGTIMARGWCLDEDLINVLSNKN